MLAAAVLITLLVSMLGWVQISPTFLSARFILLVVSLTALGSGVLAIREYWVPEARTYEQRPEIDHGPLSSVSQKIVIDRAYLSRIDVWAESSAGEADLFLRLAQPGLPPLRESHTKTSHPRWSDGKISFHFTPIPDSMNRVYTVTIGSLQPSPYIFIGLSTDDAIPESDLLINGSPDPWGNDLALRAFTSGRGMSRFGAIIQDRSTTDRLILAEIALSWLFIVVALLWLEVSIFSLPSLRKRSND